MSSLNFLQIPMELRRYPQWAVSTLQKDANGKVDKAPRNPLTGHTIDPTDKSKLVSFDVAFNSGYPAIGFCLSSADPFWCVDLDHTDDVTTQQHQATVYNGFPSTYAELSVSGLGCHIFGEGTIGGGIRRSGIELYDRDRYIICTGNAIRNLPIGVYQREVQELANRLGGVDSAQALQPSEPEQYTDEDIIERACKAVNGDKFKHLYYAPPGPTADLSQLDSQLAQFIAFWTRNHDQALRLFRNSILYRGVKGGYNTVEKYEIDYLLKRTFGHAWSMLDKDKAIQKADIDHGRAVAENILRAQESKPTHNVVIHDKAPEVKTPGIIGEIEQYLYSKGYTLLPEAALGGAIAFVAGIAGRQYNTYTGSGLNQYIAVIAHSGKGKEIANTGTDVIYMALRQSCPTLGDYFVGEFASGQAVVKKLATNPCVLSRFGEMGLFLQSLTGKGASSADIMLRRVLLDLFSKSGEGKFIHGRNYSDSEKNAKEVQSPSLSWIGDTTPNVFYECVDSGLAQEGFLGRLIVLENSDPTIYVNPNRFDGEPPAALIEKLRDLFLIVEQMRINNQFYRVPVTEEASLVLNSYESAQRDQASNLRDDGARDVINRGFLNALKLATLGAVSENPSKPIVSDQNVLWAIKIIDAGHNAFLTRFESGKVGVGDTRREAELIEALQEYTTMSPNKRRQYKTPKCLDANSSVIPLAYIKERLKRRKTFTDHRSGSAITAIKNTIHSLVESGALVEVDAANKLIEGIRPDIKCFTFGKDW